MEWRSGRYRLSRGSGQQEKIAALSALTKPHQDVLSDKSDTPFCEGILNSFRLVVLEDRRPLLSTNIRRSLAHGCTGPNGLLFDRRTVTGVGLPAPRAFEDTLSVCIALVDANNPHRHPALRAKRAPIRHLKCRATVALQRHASSPTARSAPPLGL